MGRRCLPSLHRFVGPYLSAVGLREWSEQFQLSDEDHARLQTWVEQGIGASASVSSFVAPTRPALPVGDAMPSPYIRVAHSRRCTDYLQLVKGMRGLTDAMADALDERAADAQQIWAATPEEDEVQDGEPDKGGPAVYRPVRGSPPPPPSHPG